MELRPYGPFGSVGRISAEKGESQMKRGWNGSGLSLAALVNAEQATLTRG